ncbi:LysM peptidoglycan-binding domain-containing protein [Rummeliibacillus pycnus]|uniref:LysM peptidoglycan-binding domain-containing protein n=1 Tax=Rummeliibacillus pycnus TaxID=101070 RepID=UPI000C9C3F8C|nr:LysM peptidoglycan-binding domain-containing protein [Rummeliibacillus pycnus]
MPQENYREKIEEHRQAINIEPEHEKNPSRMTRRQLHGNQNKKNKKNNRNNKLLTVLAFIFILIPVSMLVYYSYFANKNSEKTEIDHGGVQIETNEDNLSNKTLKTSSNEEKKLTAQEKAKKEKAEKIAAEKKAAEEKVAQQKAAKAAKEAAKAKKKQQQIYNEAKAAGRLYNVKPGETIESIAIQFYGSNAGIAIIKEANGIAGDSIPPGTTIAIPEQ